MPISRGSRPYAVVTQVKSEITVAKQRQHADLARIIKILRDVNYRGYVVLEYEGPRNAAQGRAALPASSCASWCVR